MLLKILTFSKALLKITADSNNSGGWLCLLLLVRQSTLRGWSSIGTPSITSLSHTHIHTHTHHPACRSSVCACAASFSRQFTSVNMCANPRAHALRALHWLPCRRRRAPLAEPFSQWSQWSPLTGRRPRHSRSCPLMCRPWVWRLGWAALL